MANYRIVRKQGDSVVLVSEKWNIPSNARNWARRGNIGKEDRDWLLLSEEDVLVVTDADAFDRLIRVKKGEILASESNESQEPAEVSDERPNLPSDLPSESPNPDSSVPEKHQRRSSLAFRRGQNK